MPVAVNEQSAEIAELAHEWPMLEALSGGTRTMREASTRLLPQWPGEEDDAYQARLGTATLFPAFNRTVKVLGGKPFAKPIALNNAPESIEAWAQDIDRGGVSLHTFAAEMFAEAMRYGLGGILVSYPRVETRPGRTVAQVEATGARPYWVRVKHDQILGWQVEESGKLGQLRIRETYAVPDGPFGVKMLDQVRVLFPGGWQVYREVDGHWAVADEGRIALPVIPFVPLYGVREDFMLGRSPLLELAYNNVKHWQSQSDQDTITHVARVPILTARDVGEEFKLTVGASAAVDLGTGPNAELKYVEHSGAAIEAGRNELRDLEEQMVQSGAELLVKREGQRTATESNNDAEGNKSDLQRMAENFEDALDQALWLTAQYARLPEAGTVSLFSDYGAATLTDASAQLVKDLALAGMLTKATALRELKRRGVLAAEVDPEDEIEGAAAEGVDLGLDDGDGGAV